MLKSFCNFLYEYKISSKKFFCLTVFFAKFLCFQKLFFKDFVEKVLFKDDFKEFQVPENIYLTSINYDTGSKSAAGEKNIIIEALKLKDINNLDNNNLISTNGSDKIIKFRQFY